MKLKSYVLIYYWLTNCQFVCVIFNSLFFSVCSMFAFHLIRKPTSLCKCIQTVKPFEPISVHLITVHFYSPEVLSSFEIFYYLPHSCTLTSNPATLNNSRSLLLALTRNQRSSHSHPLWQATHVFWHQLLLSTAFSQAQLTRAQPLSNGTHTLLTTTTFRHPLSHAVTHSQPLSHAIITNSNHSQPLSPSNTHVQTLSHAIHPRLNNYHYLPNPLPTTPNHSHTQSPTLNHSLPPPPTLNHSHTPSTQDSTTTTISQPTTNHSQPLSLATSHSHAISRTPLPATHPASTHRLCYSWCMDAKTQE